MAKKMSMKSADKKMEAKMSPFMKKMHEKGESKATKNKERGK